MMSSEPLMKDEFERFEESLKEDIKEIKENQQTMMSIIGDTKALLIRIDNIKEHHDRCREINDKTHDVIFENIREIERDMEKVITKDDAKAIDKEIKDLEKSKLAKKDLAMYITISSIGLGTVFTILNFILGVTWK